MEENDKELAECFREGLKANPPIKVTAADFQKICDMIDNPPPPSPALIKAMTKLREMQKGKSE